MSAMLAALLLHAVQVPQPPKTVNDQVIGKAEDFRTAGPARVCMNATSVDIDRGETAYLAYSGIHSGSIDVFGPKGSFSVHDGDAWAKPRGGTKVDADDANGRTIIRYRFEGQRTYMIYGPSPYGGAGSEVPRVRVDGKALGRARDRAILARIQVHAGAPAGCAAHYIYGWDNFLGPEEE